MICEMFGLEIGGGSMVGEGNVGAWGEIILGGRWVI